MQTDIYILMPSLRTNYDHMLNMFDIKGYIDSARSASAEDFKAFKFGKDENFVNS